ncbi:hypothetical protein [Acetobacter sp. DsW_063]|uniref:hypothetical protein n=1 Tax=Acetobacter sp. DsW_063 TaxID=1514894 RepID=UPI000A37EC80|nr:hypothetical protein [Acetobacter sp. DsW_063]
MSEAITPRGYSFKRASAYLGISLSTFRKSVLPRLQVIDISPGRRIVPKDQLDSILDGANPTAPKVSDNPWDASLS